MERDIKMLKEAISFSKLNINEGWELAPGAGPGIEMKMLSGSLDEEKKNWCKDTFNKIFTWSI